jgi:glycerophosphoryl diester phosphodiesterase
VSAKRFLTEGRVHAFAHRGDSAEHPPGNRWSAFASAVEVGFDHLESDAHLTSDDEVVLFHDDRLDDETTASGPLADRSWDDLRDVRYVADGTLVNEGPMRLADALEQWPEVCWNLDAKHDRVVEPLVETVQRAGAAGRVLLTAFSWRRLRRLRQLAGEGVATGHSRLELFLLRALAWLRVPLPRLGDAVQLPERWKGVTVVDQRFVDACHRAGIAVHVWTINDADDMERLFDLGVDAVMTDRPRVLRDVLQRRGTW